MVCSVFWQNQIKINQEKETIQNNKIIPLVSSAHKATKQMKKKKHPKWKMPEKKTQNMSHKCFRYTNYQI